MAKLIRIPYWDLFRGRIKAFFDHEPFFIHFINVKSFGECSVPFLLLLWFPTYQIDTKSNFDDVQTKHMHDGLFFSFRPEGSTERFTSALTMERSHTSKDIWISGGFVLCCCLATEFHSLFLYWLSFVIFPRKRTGSKVDGDDSLQVLSLRYTFK